MAKSGIYSRPAFALKQTRKQGYKCFYCKCQLLSHKDVPDGHPRRATRDHYVPRAAGGRNGPNIVIACFRCNNLKDNKSPEDFIDSLEKTNEQA